MPHPIDTRALAKIAMLGNHLPRQCGIATFTTHLMTAIAAESRADCFVLAMNDAGKAHAYPPRVRFAIPENDPGAYRRAADFLNVNRVDVVSLQHEYGIFGGKSGSNVVDLLRELRMPIVTTLHTILSDPNPTQRAVMDELASLSTRLVVMSAKGRELLHQVHGVPESKIDLVPHGIPATPPRAGSKDRLGVENRSVILTFGLLSPDKGIEYVIDALPAILARFPDVIYVVLGATHPHVKERYGETYRIALRTRAEVLGVDSSIIFHDRFVGEDELGEFLAAADIYVTPYLKAEQITSGTLAYALGAGKAIVSTPYWYAQELCADGRGVVVPARDPAALAREVSSLLADDAGRAQMSERAAAYGSVMGWPSVAKSYLGVFARARAEHADRRRTVFQATTLARRPVELPEGNLAHLRTLTDDTGVLQHATFTVPRYDDGYCLDDNARALRLMALLEDAGTDDAPGVRALASRYLAFVSHAFHVELGRFRNFFSYSRRWTEDCGSEDSHGRALWALGTVVGRSADPAKQSLAGNLFHAAVPAITRFTSPRAWAFALLGIDEYLRAFQGDSSVEAVRAALAGRLVTLHQKQSSSDWPWFEERLTYENARLSHALIASGTGMRDDETLALGLRSLAWLAELQRSGDGYFVPIGSDGFYARGGKRALFDQQPVEAYALVSACVEAHRATGDASWVSHGRRALMWFMGHNQQHLALFDPATGGCRDGLHADRTNENQGAESTLSWLLSLAESRTALRLVPAAEMPNEPPSPLRPNGTAAHR